MRPIMKISGLQLVGFLLLLGMLHECQACAEYNFVVQESSYTRLCSTKNILTVNGQFPGPTIYVRKGDNITVNVYNRGDYNITIHWHGVKQPRNPWGDGTEYITQCSIQPGANFTQRVLFSTEEGTVWWHAHSQWKRATVHGAIIVYPQNGTSYPFPEPHAEVPIILGEWWKQNISDLYETALQSGGEPNISDALTINGQPGDLYPCSQPGTFRLTVEYGKTYMLRLINVAITDIMFFAIAKHNVTVVGTDGSYTKPLSSDYIAISPGQTMDLLLEANQTPDQYYMAARVYSATFNLTYDNTTTTAIIQYSGNYTPTSPPPLPNLPYYNDTNASFNFFGSLRSLADQEHPISVPFSISTSLFYTISINTFPCANNSCAGPNGTRLASSVNNISFVDPSLDILEAYYHHVRGVYGTQFPSFPPLVYNFTAHNLTYNLQTPEEGTEVRVLEYNSTVEIVFQGTNLVAGTDHPMHLHGYSFYVVGQGFGNFDPQTDPST
ncbi:hypothetical protein Tsubulata_039262 [Turnera subulata]|uniref:Laccase n=1 Tax=Turnera subulata TaxID=218843 RepID=A0A9Q0GHE9_9ROSI|nr:hypothetical protein Tsubulata_039262 [Turnera subulata]